MRRAEGTASPRRTRALLGFGWKEALLRQCYVGFLGRWGCLILGHGGCP
jgi:hypothetical protein